ncbi:MAG: lysoplasmalogenase [Bacteroidales bacterium]
MKKRDLVLNIVFAILVVVVLIGILLDNPMLEYLFRPLIMLWIALYFLLNAKKRTFMSGVLTAFFFSWVGDIFVLLSGAYGNDSFFFVGTGSFSLSLLTYIFLFLFSTENDIKGLLLRNPFWIIPLAAYGLFLALLLYPRLEGFTVYLILFYIILLTGMSLSALNRRDRVNFNSFRLVFAGSLFFVISGSLLAVHSFHTEIPYADFMIMLTFIAAQYLIMRGLIFEKERPGTRE